MDWRKEGMWSEPEGKNADIGVEMSKFRKSFLCSDSIQGDGAQKITSHNPNKKCYHHLWSISMEIEPTGFTSEVLGLH